MHCNFSDFSDKVINGPDLLHPLTVRFFDFANRTLFSYAITISVI